ncbi:MAG: cytidine deaminase [Clostridiales bacterium]|nr:cytidine deaminase [Clostridiales bacterium]
MINYKNLMHLAQEARNYSYSPYSHFRVGAALLSKSGKIYTGCNIENAAYSATNCAERTAIFKAVSEGERDFVALAIVGGREGETSDFCAPCGVCRQVISEFCPKEFEIVLGNEDKFKVYTLDQLLPLSFSDKDL